MYSQYERNRQELTERIKKIEYLKYTMQSLLYWDKITYMPPGGIQYRSQVMGFLGEELYGRLSEERLMQLMKALQKEKQLDAVTAASIRRLQRNSMYVSRIPREEYRDYIQLVANAEQIWEKARAENDFLLALPYLERLMEHYRKFPTFWGYQNHPYDAWLGYYEEGFDSAAADCLIAEIKPVLLELLEKIREKEGWNREKERTKGEGRRKPSGLSIFDGLPPVNQEIQMALTKQLLSKAGFSFSNGRVDMGAHPTILASSPKDVRLVTSFHENDLRTCIFNAMYLAGKGLYEQQIDERLLGFLLAEVPSFALEEGIGRLYENKIGRSQTFWEDFMPTLQEAVPALKSCQSRELFQEVNRIHLTPIRLDADELTYMLHIIIRYELERELMEGSLSVSQLPEAWNAKYEEYLSVQPETDSQGVLQDIHWFAGYFGYFAAYLLAGLTSAQLAHCIQRDSEGYEEASAQQRFSMVNQWLSRRVFDSGAMYPSSGLVKRACGEPLNPQYYITYLKTRFSEAYDL